MTLEPFSRTEEWLTGQQGYPCVGVSLARSLARRCGTASPPRARTGHTFRAGSCLVPETRGERRENVQRNRAIATVCPCRSLRCRRGGGGEVQPTPPVFLARLASLRPPLRHLVSIWVSVWDFAPRGISAPPPLRLRRRLPLSRRGSHRLLQTSIGFPCARRHRSDAVGQRPEVYSDGK